MRPSDGRGGCSNLSRPEFDGKHSLHLGASHLIEARGKGKRGEPTARERTRLPGETRRRHLGIPILHVKD